MAGTRIASVSGLRGIVGDGLDPASAVEFAAAYAAGCDPGAIVVGHDGRATAPVFTRAVQAAVLAAGRDVLDAGAIATPTLGRLVRDRRAAGGNPDQRLAQSPRIQRSEVLPTRRDGAWPPGRSGRAAKAGAPRVRLGLVERAGEGPRAGRPRRRAPRRRAGRCRSRRHRRAGVPRSARLQPRRGRKGRAPPCSRRWDAG